MLKAFQAKFTMVQKEKERAPKRGLASLFQGQCYKAYIRKAILLVTEFANNGAIFIKKGSAMETICHE